MTYLDGKIKLLMKRKDVPPKDILSHKWKIHSHSEDELWLKCEKCGYYYSVLVFKSGAILRFFLSTPSKKETEKFMSCDECIMNSALK